MTSWVLQGFILRFTVFNISIYDLKVATLIEFGGDTKLGLGEGKRVNMPEKRAAIQGDLDRLEKSTDGNHVKFSQDQSPVMHEGRSSSFQ